MINVRCSSSSRTTSPAMAFSVARPGFDVAGIDTVVVGWRIDEDTKSELRGQWQQAVLDLAFAWVVRDLDGIEATRRHRRLEFAEARRLPMRCADEGHPTRVRTSSMRRSRSGQRTMLWICNSSMWPP